MLVGYNKVYLILIFVICCSKNLYFSQLGPVIFQSTKKTKKWFCLEVEFPQNTKPLKYVDFYFYLIQTNNPVQSAEVIWFPIMNKTNKLFDHFNIWIGIFYCIYFIIGHFCLNNKSIIMKNVFYFYIFYKWWILLQPCQILTVIFTPTSNKLHIIYKL